MHQILVRHPATFMGPVAFCYCKFQVIFQHFLFLFRDLAFLLFRLDLLFFYFASSFQTTPKPLPLTCNLHISLTVLLLCSSFFPLFLYSFIPSFHSISFLNVQTLNYLFAFCLLFYFQLFLAHFYSNTALLLSFFFFLLFLTFPYR